jgi:hypothetical protein
MVYYVKVIFISMWTTSKLDPFAEFHAARNGVIEGYGASALEGHCLDG